MAEEPEKIEGEKDKERAQEKETWDKTKQELDQYKASVEKLSDEKSELQEQVAGLEAAIEQERQETASKLASIEQKLTEKAKEEKIDDIENIDPDLVDANVIKVLKALKAEKELVQGELAEHKEALKTLHEAKEQYEADRQKSQEDARREHLKEAMLSKLDKKYGSKFRNDAVALANKKVKQSGEAPEGDFNIYCFIEQCYEELAGKTPAETPKKEKVAVDSGQSGVTFKQGEIKEGPLEDVLKDVMAKYKGKGFSMPKT